MKALGYAFLALSIALLTACPVALEEFDREPVVKTVTGGPLKARFYASPASDGGAATRFRVGETIYLVHTLENASGEKQICTPDLSRLKPVGSEHDVLIRRGPEEVWPPHFEAIRTLGVMDPLPEVPYLSPFTFSADFVRRRIVKVEPQEPFPPGRYHAAWILPIHVDLMVLPLCYATEPTSVSLGFEIVPVEE